MHVHLSTSVSDPGTTLPTATITPPPTIGADARLHKVALKIFLQAAAALAANFVILEFLAQPLSVVIFTWSLVPVVVTAAVIAVATTVFGSESMANQTVLKASQVLTDLSIINNAGILGPGILLHELGHAIVGTMLFSQAQPKITIKPFCGGVTNLNLKSPLTSLGLRLGLQSSVALIAVAGLVASALVAMIELVAAYWNDGSRPQLSYFLRCQGFCQLLNEGANGLPALIKGPMGSPHNDLTRLESLTGIQPILPLACLAVIPAVENLLLKMMPRRSTPPQTPG